MLFTLEHILLNVCYYFTKVPILLILNIVFNKLMGIKLLILNDNTYFQLLILLFKLTHWILIPNFMSFSNSYNL